MDGAKVCVFVVTREVNFFVVVALLFSPFDANILVYLDGVCEVINARASLVTIEEGEVGVDERESRLRWPFQDTFEIGLSRLAPFRFSGSSVPAHHQPVEDGGEVAVLIDSTKVILEMMHHCVRYHITSVRNTFILS